MQQTNDTLKQAAERVYYDWDRALAEHDAKALLALYADDIFFESPLVCHLLNTDRGICEGKDELRRLIEILITRKPEIRTFYRTGYFTDGKTLIWEYPRLTPQGEQMDFAEVMALNADGLIQKHRVYWGWRGVKVLKDNAYWAN